ncbi:D-alanyl-D-alanine carboxypeptidase/D-alanyl-D-alanine-endopeptidase [Catellatospora sp. NPDC049609]|uniref:D-alanyl-D-alanine carboxypeptidase/D-alanyl-D-alanine endopeptidase n=1 Tax=Catellatospora sp. NPDC049609 TaxID=3155505 RepID=UPI00343E9944
MGYGAAPGQDEPTQTHPAVTDQPPTRPGTLVRPPAARPDGAGPPATPKKRRRRGLLVTVLTLVIALGAGLAGVAVLKPGLLSGLLATPDWQSPSAAPPAEPAAPPVLTALADAPMPDPAQLRTLIDPLVTGTDLGDNVSVSVVDVTSGQVLYERGPTEMITPASNTKLVTAAAVLTARGPDHRITTRVVAGANPGEVVLIGAGDATLGVTKSKYYAGAPQLDDLAAQVKKAMGGTPITKVILDGSLFPGPITAPTWSPNAAKEGNVSKITALMINGARTGLKDRKTPFDRYNDPERAAGDAFAKLLGVPTSAVAKGKAPAAAAGQATPAASTAPSGSAATGGAPAPGTELGAVRSAPLLRQVEQMLIESDNTLAETLARQVALAKGKPASFEGAAQAMEEVLVELGLDAQQSTLFDGSGMSASNKISPRVLTSLLVKAAGGGTVLGDFFNGLPVGGWSGTMTERFLKAKDGFGVVRAKSGTLDGVNSLSGVVETADGRLLAFAVLADGVPVGMYPAQDLLDKVPAAMATCGCP